MKQQLAAILRLQLADAKVKELEGAIAKLPAHLEPTRRDLAKLEAMVAAERGRIDETLAWRKAQESLLEREHEAHRSAKSKLGASKNTKEWAAANREIENKKKAISDREAELKKVGEAMSKSASDADAHAADVEKLRAHLQTSEAEVANKVEALQQELNAAASVRDAARAHVEEKWLKLYDTVSSKKGYAVAAVHKGVCRGCHMTLPPQLNNVLARLESIESCPRCGRLVYREELLSSLTESAANPSA